MTRYVETLKGRLNNSRSRVLLSLLTWLSVVGLAAHYVVANAPMGITVVTSWVGVVALFACFIALLSRISGRLLSVPLVIVLALIVFLAIVEATAIQFSGQGFNENFFFHIEPQSFRVAWQEYRVGLILLPLAMISIGLLLRWLVSPGILTLRWSVGLLVISLLFIAWIPQSTVIGRFVKGWEDYQWLTQPREISNEAIETLSQFGLNPIGVESLTVTAKLPAVPRNLIIVFLESFDRSFVTDPQFRQLTPGLRELAKDYGEWSSIYSGANVTIEGLIAANCGLMPPMSRPSDMMLGSNTPLSRLACLPDVLSKAGYQQVFMGGAPGEFAGKEQFFTGHGFDEFLGWNFWRGNSTYFEKRNQWGLQDDHLFAEAISKIDELRELGKPFHLSLLTLSTHIPGAIAPGCTPLGNETDLLLEGIHCTDQVVSRFIRALEARGDLDDSLLVVVADHAMFRTPKTRELFGEAMEDYRVFTMIAGAGAEPASDTLGATYDLAPTLLDFLDVEHNVNFLQGQSLAQNSGQDRYVITRFRDFTKQGVVNNDPGACQSTELPGELSIPLEPCEKKALTRMLGSYVNQFSAGISPDQDNLGCSVYSGAKASRAADTQHVSIWFAGQEQISQFTTKGWSIDPSDEGLFVLRLNEQRSVVERRFFGLLSLKDQLGFLGLLDSLAVQEQLLLIAVGDVHSWMDPQLSGLMDGPLGQSNKLSLAILDGGGLAIQKTPVESGVVPLSPSDCETEDWSGEILTWSREDVRGLTAEMQERILQPRFELVSVGGPKAKSLFAGPGQQMPLRRGVHLIRYDPWLKRIVEHKQFDTYLSAEEDLLLQGWLAGYVPGSHEFLLMAAVDEASRNLSEKSVAALLAMGFSQADQIGFRSSYAGVIGGDLSQPYIRMSPSGSPVRLEVVLNGPSGTALQPPAISASQPVLVAHAGGEFENRTYLNSREALDENYDYGYRLFEVDLSWSSDEKLVAIHDWERSWLALGGRKGEVPTARQFAATRGKGGHDLLDLVELCDWLKVHDEAWIVTDIKSENLRGLKEIQEGCDVSERFIPQIFATSEYGVSRGLGFDHIILSLYRLAETPAVILDLVSLAPLYAVALPEEMLNSEPWRTRLMEQDTCVLAYTVNSPSSFSDLIERGLCGVYTDFLVSRHKQGDTVIQ